MKYEIPPPILLRNAGAVDFIFLSINAPIFFMSKEKSRKIKIKEKKASHFSLRILKELNSLENNKDNLMAATNPIQNARNANKDLTMPRFNPLKNPKSVNKT